MANNVSALGAAPGNAGGSAAASNTATSLGQNGAANSVTADPTQAAATDWVSKFCEGYADAMLAAGQYFLYAALLLGIIIAGVEIYVAIKAAGNPPAGGGGGPEAGVAPLSLSAVIEALKSLLTALSSAKIWLALAILGLLLLWMAATAPRLCVPGDPGDGNGGAEPANAAANTSGANTVTNGSGNNMSPPAK